MGVASITWGLGVAEHVIGDALWQRMWPALAAEPHMRLHDPGGLRRFVGACLFVLRQGCTWTELGWLVPSADAARKRFRRWAVKGVWDRLLACSQPVAAPDVLHIDSTAIKCHRTATGARGGGEQAIGRSRGGLTSKVHHAVDSLGFIRRVLATPGQHADCRHAEALTAGLQPVCVVYPSGEGRGGRGSGGLGGVLGGPVPIPGQQFVQA